MRKFSFFSVFVCLSFLLHSQDYLDVFKISYDIAAPRSFTATDEEARFNELFMDLTLPIPVGKHAIITGSQYENFNLTTFPGLESFNYQGLMIKAGVKIQHSEKWSGTYIALPKWMGQQLNSDAFQVGLISILNYKKSDNFKYKYGLYINEEFFGTLVVPIFGLYWKGEKAEANLTLPISADFNYSLTEQLKVGFSFQGIKKSYLLSETYNGLDPYLEKANNEIGIYLQYKAGPIMLQALGGHSIIRSFRAFEQGDETNWTLSAIAFGDNRLQLNSDFDNGLFVKFSTIYRLDLVK